ncbi:PREDICTED: uncharacterized protein LOC109487108 [Branchiostoma belcheri]|uniref:Uncharacterized protein LOC109487108 n=1 Tax=Branchiostoma belcheri TaxID=7741 RepID=A0A6P5AU87_BRABE|nr:PREDICTED: uncharacterized protein LOC109487108 [Branchiostoma belcheri]
MNWKALLGLAISYVAVLLVGAAVFKVLEEAFSPPVNETIGLPRRSDLEGVLQNFSDHQNLSVSLQELLGLIDAADKVRSVNVKYAESVNTTAQLYIDFFDSLFFCGTIITTIGYGHITPQTDPGKLFCIAYALIGIPITFFLLAAIGIKIGDANRWGEKKIKRALKVLERWPGVLRSCTIFLITVTGFGIFFFAPAYLFTIVEGWTYLHSIYYVFITLSTIGFGDMVTTLQDIENIYYDYAYKIAVIIWIMIGLSFLATIIDLISDAMKQMQQQMQENLKNVATGVSLDKFGNSLAGSVKGLGTPQMLKRKGKGKKGKAESAPDISTGYDTLEKERGMAWGPDRETILVSLFCIAYALIGIPITVFFLAGIGIKLGDANRWVEKKVKTAVSKLARNPGVIRIATLLITLFIGFGTFFFVPAYIFTLVEKWKYLDAIYYVFITLSTIGFGDMVTTVNELEGVEVFYDYLYKVAVIIWIMTGLTFLSMIIDLVQDGLKTVKQKMKSELDAVNLDKFPGRNMSLMALKKKRGGGSKTDSPAGSNSAVDSLEDDKEEKLLSEDNREKGIKETII